MDRVRPLKLEDPGQGGEETDEFPTSVNPNEDYLDCRGITLQNNVSNDGDVFVSRDAAGNLVFKDQVNTQKTLTDLVVGTGGLTEESHRLLDQLVHNLAENYYEEYQYAGGRVTNVITWADETRTKKIREEQYTYDSGKIVQVVIIQYNAAGAEVERITESYTYSGNRVASVSAVRSTP